MQPLASLCFASGNTVEVLFEPCGVVVVDEICEALVQQASHREGNPLGNQSASAAHHIVAVDDHRDDGGIGRRATNTFLFQSLHEARLCVSGRGLGGVGFSQHVADGQRFANSYLRQQCIILGLALGPSVLVVAFLIGLEEPALGEHSSGSSELGGSEIALGKRGGLESDRHGLTLRVHHLAGNRALPNQVIKFQLIRAQNAGKRGGSSEAIARWANSFVGFLGVLGLALIEAWLAGN